MKRRLGFVMTLEDVSGIGNLMPMSVGASDHSGDQSDVHVVRKDITGGEHEQ